MIIHFKQTWLEEFWNTGNQKRVPPELTVRLLRKLDILHTVKELKDIAAPPSNHLHPLYGDREGQWTISVNGPWRLCFRFHQGQVFDVELIQYH